MSPDEIRSFLSRHYPQLHAERRQNPDGWAFFLGAPLRGSKSNRIVRATRSRPNAITRLKRSVSSRHKSKEVEQRFSGDTAALRNLVEAEIKLFKTFFAKGGDR